ncbi:hypothetical protein [Estrella lausannensis]|uniref:Uncharacterized protein n=1 Tax=Estrella lausannensis TaxID=483423 RepID=A0A0H5E471_9BACT|nr:hypothetical protein [Estrella lausannensis]CRX38025.1 Hypothetical protein ELAC_0673 [Estrella lausannensis]
MKRYLLKICCGLFVLGIFSGCQKRPLSVEVRYISEENLASYYVESPDPRLSYPRVGQELKIRWNIPDEYYTKGMVLSILLNMRNYSERHYCFELKCQSGSKTLAIANDDFFATGGILSFKAEVLKYGVPLYKTTHQLHVELIRFEDWQYSPEEEGDSSEEPPLLEELHDEQGKYKGEEGE